MAIEVVKVILKHVQDASGLEERIVARQFSADEVVAVIGKTQGNGGVDDFTRILADNAFRAALAKHNKRSAEAIRESQIMLDDSMFTITGTARLRSTASPRRRSATPPCSFPSTRCTRARRAEGLSSRSSTSESRPR
jgi:hypothetical protein